MSTPRLSLVMGSGLTTPSGSEVSLPVPEDGAVHLHLHLGATASPAAEGGKRPLGGWGGLIVGIGLMAAFGGGYQLGHRPAPDDVSNLRPMPAPASFVPPEPPMPSIAAGGTTGDPTSVGNPATDHSPDPNTTTAGQHDGRAEHCAFRAGTEPQRLRA